MQVKRRYVGMQAGLCAGLARVRVCVARLLGYSTDPLRRQKVNKSSHFGSGISHPNPAVAHQPQYLACGAVRNIANAIRAQPESMFRTRLVTTIYLLISSNLVTLIRVRYWKR
jgi:hypothetical protein